LKKLFWGVVLFNQFSRFSTPIMLNKLIHKKVTRIVLKKVFWGVVLFNQFSRSSTPTMLNKLIHKKETNPKKIMLLVFISLCALYLNYILLQSIHMIKMRDVFKLYFITKYSYD
jgi:hypothetical protein